MGDKEGCPKKSLFHVKQGFYSDSTDDREPGVSPRFLQGETKISFTF
jgi:hypothetical protein